ncbi:MAG TPA: TetR/AcrR family transcriptional regulator [Clostridiales bacterium]|nr:TetR/AcrR family transcriptional regulator [Clostridiales bacterium]
MQVQKDDVRNKIIETATEEFFANGYLHSSLRNIAAQAGMTVGNLYSYFSGKDDLFENVVAPAWEKLYSLMSIEYSVYESTHSPTLLQITDLITHTFISNKAGFSILINGSKGSRYENVRSDITRVLSRRLRAELSSGLKEEKIDPLLADALAASLMEGFITIFNNYGGDIDRLRNLIQELLVIMLGNLDKKMLSTDGR